MYLFIDHANPWSLTSLVFLPHRLDLLWFLDLIWYEPSMVELDTKSSARLDLPHSCSCCCIASASADASARFHPSSPSSAAVYLPYLLSSASLLSLLLEPSVRNLRVINYLKYRQEYISHFDKFGHIADMTAVVSVTTILTRPTLSSTKLYSNLDASA